MNKIYKIYSIKQSPIVLILGFLFFIQQKAEAQVNVTLTYTKSADNNCGTCTDCASVVGCGADQYWETEMNPSGGTYTGNGDNDNGGISNTSFTSTDIGFWCPGGTVQGRVRTCEDDDFGGCGGLLDDCVTGWVNGSTVTINTTNTSVGATAWSISGGSCTASGTWSLSSSGSWPGNNIVNTTGTTNTTCGTARNLGTNTSGNPVSGFNDESVDCTSSVWYTYYLTQDLASIDFDASASGLLNGCSEDEVRFNTTNNCTSGYCNVSDDYGIGTWGINNPRQGYYFIRVSMPTTVSGRQYDFKFVVNKGSVVTRPANDNYCGATSLSAAFNYNSTQLSATVNTDYATSEDFCSTNEPDNSNEQSAWYKFTTTATPPAIITLNPTASGACTVQAFVYSGVASGPCTGSAFTSYNTATNFNGLSLIDYIIKIPSREP